MILVAYETLLHFARTSRRRMPRRCKVILLLVLLSALLALQITLFGFGPTRRGGQLGRFVDNMVRKTLYERAAATHAERFVQITGYPLPDIAEPGVNRVGVQVLTHTWLTETLERTYQRHDALEYYLSLIAAAGENEDKNKKNKCSTITRTAPPVIIIQANMGDWYRPIEWEAFGAKNANTDHNDSNKNTTSLLLPKLQALIFDEEQVEEFMQTHFTKLYKTYYQQSTDRAEKIQLFGFAAVYHFGGIFVSPDIRNSRSLIQVAPGLGPWMASNLPLAAADSSSSSILCQEEEEEKDREAALLFQSVNGKSLSVLAATPKHPRVKCVINELINTTPDGSGWQKVFHLLQGSVNWDPTCEPRCCPLQNSLPNLLNTNHRRDVFTTLETGEDSVPTEDISHQDDGVYNERRPRFQMTIQEKLGIRPSVLKPKNRCSDRLRSRWCSPGWPCNRCLRMPFKGSLEACRLFCKACYQKTVCAASPVAKNNVIMEVTVQETRNQSHQKRIPRIIHQTWFEELTTARYPHLQRLQHSWKASGFDYRFYTDDDCVRFIEQHYPKRFVDAYNAIIPGAFKADFFRLLVLFKHGGIYADIDVQLDADLDNFITKDLSFFVPRDVALDYWPNSNYCLWNGLLGASPGNPIIAKAIEDVMTTVLNRVDYYDIEGGLCSRDPNAEIWKLRTLPILILTGPCALGMSVNAALGKVNVLQGHDLGWLQTANVSARHTPPDHYWGNALTLLADRYDLGELRFTDIDRNLLIASSNQDRISKSPIDINSEHLQKTPIHYSKSETDIVGEFGTYEDALSANEQVRLVISHEYV